MASGNDNQPIGNVPFGNAFLVATPYTDHITAALQAQQQDRRKYQQQTTLQTDELMSKELANVRSADMGTVIDKYGKWKEVAQKMLNPAIQSNPKLYNDLQIQKNAALGETMGAINRSSQLNAQAKELVTERRTKPNLYSDDFGDKIAAFNNTPMNQLAAHPKYGDLTNPDAFRYTGSQTDFGKIEQVASGQPKPIEGADKVEKISDLQTRRTPTLFGNTPTQFFENMKGQLAQHIPGRDASAAWEAIPEQQKAAVEQQFASISPEKWMAMTGTAKPQVIAPADPNNPAENYAAYRAKVYAINSVPRAGTPKVETNEEAKIGLQEQERLRTVAAQHVNRMAEMATRYTNQKDFYDIKRRATDPEGTTPSVDAIQTLLEHPGQMYNGKTAAQLSQDVLSNWNSQGNSKNVQSKLTVVPSFGSPQTNGVKGFNELAQSGLNSVGIAYNAIPEKERTATWGTIMQQYNSASVPVEKKKELLVKAYNEINKANGSSVRFTADDLDKSVPLLHQRREVDDKFDNTKYQVVKTGTSEFQDVVNEKRNAVLSSKKPVILGQENKEPAAGASGIKWQ